MPRRRLAASLSVVSAAVTVVFLLWGHAVLHLEAGGWTSKGATRDTVALEGHLVEWEWLHVGATVRLLEPGVATLPAISTQDAFRFVPALLVGALRGPAGGLYGAALIASIAMWAAAAAAVATASSRVWSWRSDGRTSAAAFSLYAGAVLIAQGTGYIAFLGNVDAHQFGYAAVALWCGAWVVFRPDELPREPTGLWRAAAVGLALCAAGYTMEVSYPLLLSAWLLLAAAARRRDLTGPDALRRAVVMTASYVVPYAIFQSLVRATFGTQLVTLNDPLQQVAVQLTALQQSGLISWVDNRAHNLLIRWPLAFPLPISLLAALGLVVAPRRWALWALLMLLPLLAAMTVTKLLVRTLYLAHPPVYVLAAAGAAWLSVRVGALAPAIKPLPFILLALLLTGVSVATNADLWGDYFLPVWWWQIQ